LSAIPIERVEDVDPQGSDGAEHPEETGLAIDGDPSSAWGTDHYNSAEFGGLKDGLGLFLDLGEEARVERIVLRSAIEGWSFEIRAASDPREIGESIPSTDGSETFTVGSEGRVSIDLEPTETTGLLVWITRLGADDGRFAASIADVTVEGPK
jgi:hypothetical protein